MTVDVHDAQQVRRATGRLRAFNEIGVLGAADAHVAATLGRLGEEHDDRVLLAAALAVRALRSGSVCVDLAAVRAGTAVEGVAAAALESLPWPSPQEWVSALRASRLVAGAPGREPEPEAGARPLRLLGELLYLDRYWRQEQRIATALDEAATRPQPAVDEPRLRAALARLFPGEAPDRQRLAAAVAAHRWVSVLAGGPGTGKTTTVAKLIAVLQDQAAGRLRVALAAPTAVAAARLTFAAAAAVGRFPEPDQQRVGPLEATTLHRLLGRRPGSRTRFRHDRDNRLPFDVVVVDEASMVSLTLMSRLVDALRSDSRLLLVGDPDQLASVEAGAVLGDLVQREAPAAVTGPTGSGLARHDLDSLAEPERDAVVRRGVVRLAEVHRFSGAIQALAEAVRLGRPAEVLAVLDGSEEGVEFVELDPAAPGREVPDSVRADVVAAGASLHEAARAGDGETALRRLAAHQLLCGHREGPYGVAHWNRRAEEWLRGSVEGYAADGPWYVGRPLLVTANDYQLRLFNGDTGVVVEVDGHPRAAFHRGGTLHLLAPSRLPDVTTVHAMSVHRSQGSQYDAVTVVLPPVDSPLLTRELLYTALTRAKRRVRVLGSRAAVEGAVQRPIVRASGLRARA